MPALIRAAEPVLEYPMVDQDPLPRWTFGRVTLLGDAAHPMVPRGSNGAGQAILDARALSRALTDSPDAVTRLPPTRRNGFRRRPGSCWPTGATRPTHLREVWQRTGDRPFTSIEDVIKPEELAQISQRYKEVAGYSAEALASGG